MTIPDGPADGGSKPPPETKPDARVRRPEPARTAAKRAGDGSAAAPQDAASKADASPGQNPPDQKVSDAVAHAVKLGYDVISENIRQGREAAGRFRQGQYSLYEAPGDLEIAALRLLQLARELSTTTFDVCERLLKELGEQRAPGDPTSGLPPFRAATPTPAPPSTTAPPPPAPDPAAMKLTVRFVGAPLAVSHTASLSRPKQPTAAASITAGPLAPSPPGGAPITGVTFEVDMSVEGIVAVVTVPAGQAAGVYSGLVHVADDPIPLGVLTVEIPK